jgi:hypothetical protein
LHQPHHYALPIGSSMSRALGMAAEDARGIL